MFCVFRDTTPVVEGLSIDEAFLEVGGLRRIRGCRRRSPSSCATTCAARSGLPISVGVARTKYLAKVASAVSKPEGLLVVPVEKELEFLHALPVERLWGVGKVTSQKLRDRRIATVGDVAKMYEIELVQLLGPAAATTSTRWRTTATRDRSTSASGAGRWAPSTRSVAARTPPPSSTWRC